MFAHSVYRALILIALGIFLRSQSRSQTYYTFEDVLTQAITQLLSVPVTDGPVALRPVGIGYGYADARLEGLTAAQKQLLRMGPENVRKVQSKLREIAPHVTTRNVSSQ